MKTFLITLTFLFLITGGIAMTNVQPAPAPIEVTNYLVHHTLRHREFIDFNTAVIGNYDYNPDELFLRITINNEPFDFLTATQESIDFIKNTFHIDLQN